MNAGSELIDVVDDADCVIGSATRREVRAQNLLHRAVYIFVLNAAGAIFVHQRTATKDVYPSYWDVAVGGVVEAGEDYADAAARELDEEIGARTAVLQPLGPVRYADAWTRLLGRAFVATYDGPITLQADEVAQGEFVPIASAARLLTERHCCPDGARAFADYRRELDRLTTTR